MTLLLVEIAVETDDIRVTPPHTPHPVMMYVWVTEH